VVLRQTRLACQIVCLKAPREITFDGVIDSTAESHAKSSFRHMPRLRDGRKCADDARTGYVLRSCQIHMFSTRQEVCKPPEFSARVGELRSEKEVMDLGIGSHVHDRGCLRATTRAGEKVSVAAVEADDPL